MQLVSAKFYFVVLGYDTGSQGVARLENRILGQLKMGEHQANCRALHSRYSASEVSVLGKLTRGDIFQAKSGSPSFSN